MKKTEFFTANTPAELQLNVNSLLQEHKEIGIIDSGMTLAREKDKVVYSFYILYESVETATSATIAAQMENVLPEQESLSETSDSQLQ